MGPSTRRPSSSASARSTSPCPATFTWWPGPCTIRRPIGFALYSQIFGATLVVMRKFDPEQALALIARHRCTSTFMAPTLVKRLVDLPAEVHRRYDVSSMRVIVVAGAPCPMQVKEDVARVLGPVLYEFYGSTELGINTVLRPEDVLRKPNSCGRAAPGTELAILDDAGQPVAPGTPGTLYVRRTLGVFDGYYKNDAATRETTLGEWLTVGDVAWMDADGFVYICDRKRDMIISGGVNIYPAEIEDVLHRHPGDPRRRRLRRARRRVGRARACRRAAPAGVSALRAGGARLRPRPPGRLQGAPRRLLRGGLSSRHRGQARQAPAPRALLAGPRDSRLADREVAGRGLVDASRYDESPIVRSRGPC